MNKRQTRTGSDLVLDHDGLRSLGHRLGDDLSPTSTMSMLSADAGALTTVPSFPVNDTIAVQIAVESAPSGD